jgi:hypothetical protein
MDDASQSIQAHLDGVTPEKRRRDAQTLLELMSRVTGETLRLWGSIVGFGQYHYKYESGRQGDAPAAAFAPRKAAATTISPTASAHTTSSSSSWARIPPAWDVSTSRIWTRSTSPSSKTSCPSRTEL